MNTQDIIEAINDTASNYKFNREFADFLSELGENLFDCEMEREGKLLIYIGDVILSKIDN